MHDDDRHALLLQPSNLLAERPGVEPAGAADGDLGPVEVALDAVPGMLGHVQGGGGSGRGGGDRGGDRGDRAERGDRADRGDRPERGDRAERN